MPQDYDCRAKLFRALGHPARQQILEILAREPVCVCDLMQQTGHRQPYISQQLAILREAGLVTVEREGLNMRYRLVFPDLLIILKAGADLISLVEQPVMEESDPEE